MFLKIKQVLLWPKDPELNVRSLEFLPDKINLITGRNRTGKSSITWIVDYVLGSDKCAIPVGHIRDTVSWYGLLLNLGTSDMLVARAEPGTHIESSEYVVIEDFEGSVPNCLAKNSNRDGFKRRMNILSGLPNLRFDAGETSSGYLAAPGFRDLASFNFLPQHIVANPYTLLFKADTTEHRERLRTIFPMVLGAVDAAILAAEHEYGELQRRLRRLNLERDNQVRAADIARGELASLYVRAVEIGLLPLVTSPPATATGYVQALRSVPDRAQSFTRTIPTHGTTEFATQKLLELRAAEDDLDRKLLACRRRLGQVQRLRAAASDYSTQMERATSRVVGAGWLEQRLKATSACPICGGQDESSRTHVAMLASAAQELTLRQQATRTAPSALHKEEQQYLVEARELEGQLSNVRAARAEIERPPAAASGGQTLEDVLLFAGRIDQVLRTLAATATQDSATMAIEEIKARIRNLESLLDKDSKQRRLSWGLSSISRKISEFAKFMHLERSDDFIELDIKELTLSFSAKQGSRRDHLWEIGSGENWMGYHLATLLAIHETFRELSTNYVPGFLIIDQPSQVYFPRGYDLAAGQSHDRDSYAVKGTRRIFEALAISISRSRHDLQVIVTEHADEIVLHNISELHVAADWHGPPEAVDYLVPREWLGLRSVDATI